MTLIGKLKYRKSIRVGDVRPARVQVHTGRAHGQDSPSADAVLEHRLSADLDENVADIKAILGMDMDLLIRQFRIQINGHIDARSCTSTTRPLNRTSTKFWPV